MEATEGMAKVTGGGASAARAKEVDDPSPVAAMATSGSFNFMRLKEEGCDPANVYVNYEHEVHTLEVHDARLLPLEQSLRDFQWYRHLGLLPISDRKRGGAKLCLCLGSGEVALATGLSRVKQAASWLKYLALY